MKDFTSIDDCYEGIYSDEAINILMDQSSISNCNAGISMQGNSSAGLVKMLCSTLYENQKGIYGNDILLAIDGLINQQNSHQKPSNTFVVSGKNQHFSINYILKNVTDVLGRYNYWENQGQYAITNGFGKKIQIDQKPTGGGACKGANFEVCEAPTPNFPIALPEDSAYFLSGFCPDEKTCDGTPIMVNYWSGYNCLYNQEIEGSVKQMRPLAEESYNTQNKYVYCDDMLLEARAWVGGFDAYEEIDIKLYFDSLTCSFKWPTTVAGAQYILEKMEGSEWIEVANPATVPHYISSSERGLYRLRVVYKDCPVYISEPVEAACGNGCEPTVEILDVYAYYDPYQEKSFVDITTYQSQETDFLFTVQPMSINGPLNFEYILHGVQGLNANTVEIPFHIGEYTMYNYIVNCIGCGNSCPDTLNIIYAKSRIYKNNKSDKLKNESRNFYDLMTYPNPFSDLVTLELDSKSEGQALITVLDVDGRVVTTKSIFTTKGKSSHTIESKDWMTGVYILEIKNDSETIRKKIMKMK